MTRDRGGRGGAMTRDRGGRGGAMTRDRRGRGGATTRGSLSYNTLNKISCPRQDVSKK